MSEQHWWHHHVYNDTPPYLRSHWTRPSQVERFQAWCNIAVGMSRQHEAVHYISETGLLYTCEEPQQLRDLMGNWLLEIDQLGPVKLMAISQYWESVLPANRMLLGDLLRKNPLRVKEEIESLMFSRRARLSTRTFNQLREKWLDIEKIERSTVDIM